MCVCVKVVKAVRKWEADHEDKEKELKKLNIDLATIEADVVASGDEEDPIYLFRKHFSKTGSYLRPDDMKFCVTKTNFTEDQIIEWFQRFRCEKIIIHKYPSSVLDYHSLCTS